MRKPEAVIFDMDGVLIDSEPIHIEIEKELFHKLGITVSAEVHRGYLGTSGDYMYTDLKSRFGLSDSVEKLLELDESFRCAYFKALKSIRPNEGVPDLLLEIKQSGLKLAVATSSSPRLAAILLEECHISSLFDAVVTTAEAGRSKPFPDVYLLAAHKIGIHPSNCIVFEDSPNGLSAAKDAGMYCIAVQSGSVNVQELSRADFLIRTFGEIFPGQMVKLFSDYWKAK